MKKMNEFLKIYRKLKEEFKKHSGSTVDIKEFFLYTLSREDLLRLSLSIKHEKFLSERDANHMIRILKLYAKEIKGFDTFAMNDEMANKLLEDFQQDVMSVLCVRNNWAKIENIEGSNWTLSITKEGKAKIKEHERMRNEMADKLGLF